MKIDKLCGERFKERPSDCVIDSHALMVRGGYMKGVANGIYSSYMPLRRITRKIENIIGILFHKSHKSIIGSSHFSLGFFQRP